MRSAVKDIQLSAALSSTEQGQKVFIGNDENHALIIYLREMGRLPKLSAEEEHTLAVRARAGDSEAKGKLIEAHLRLSILTAPDCLPQLQSMGMLEECALLALLIHDPYTGNQYLL